MTGTAILLIMWMFFGSEVRAQSTSRDKERSRTEQDLTARVQKAEDSLLREYMDVVNEYYKQGDRAAAVDVLKRVQSINPKMEGVKERIDLLTEEMIQENGIKADLDVSKGWVPICEVDEGRAFRLAATGDYRMDLTTVIPLAGLSTTDPQKDHIAGAPFGAVIGLIVSDGKPGDPFPVNAGVEHTPKKSGQLFLRVNVPAAAKTKGTIKVQISGGIRPLGKKR